MEPLNPLPKAEAEKAISGTIGILDRYAKLYGQLSGGRFRDYLGYMASGGFADEDEFIKPKLFTDFLKEVLLFPADEYSPEHATGTGVPDVQPSDTLLHPFFFEIKGTNTSDLTQHLDQVHKYLKAPFRLGVLTNMRDILVYDARAVVPILRVSLVQLYRACKDQPKHVLEFPNTRRFLEFVSRFRRQSLGRARKVEMLKSAKDHSLLPDIDPDELVRTIHKVVRVLTEDARRFKQDLEVNLKHDMTGHTRNSVLAELENIAHELDHRYVPAKQNQVARFLNARAGSVEHRAFEVFLTRVAYFTMTRFLIARMWEDVGFLEQRLYDGGFAKWYETLGERIQEVLKHAFLYAGEKYSWLYGQQHNNYFWYDLPSEEAIIDVLYEFARHNLGRLDSDVLGTVYEQFVERVDRKNKGQYYTPREIVSLIWDRVGFTDEEGFFRFEKGQRMPRKILDIATGSGGFLVEAARRIRTQTKDYRTDINELLRILMCLTDGLCGCEITRFAHYITEVNLLIQLTPVIRAIVEKKKEIHRPLIFLNTIPGNSLALVGVPSLFGGNSNSTVRDRPRELVSSNPKAAVSEHLIEFDQFDYVCSNPPYVGEKGHKELFRATRADMPFWDRHYQGKMDYLYWFIILGLLKLREGGKLGFITTSYWPAADGASHLREYILEKSVIREIIDFGETRIFEGAPGQHNMVFVLEKCSDATANVSHPDGCPNPANVERKKHHHIKIVKVKKVPPAESEEKTSAIARAVEHVSRHIEKDEFSDEYLDIYFHPETQDKLDGGAWNLFYTSADAAVLDQIEYNTEPITKLCELDCGIFSNADYLSAKYIELIPPSRVRNTGISVGDGIFVVRKTVAEDLRRDDPEHRVVEPTYKNSDIDPYLVVEPDEQSFLLYVDDEFEPASHKDIMTHLSRYREVLAARLERYDENYPWWRLHRPHNRDIYESRKIVTSRWGKQNVYALQEGGFYENSDINLYVRLASTREDLRYILALLNSQVLQYWVSHKGRGEGVSRQIRLKRIPIRRIDFNKKREIAKHDKVVRLVDLMIETKQQLAKLNRFFAARLTRLSGPKELPEPDVEAVTRSLKGSALRRLHNHPKVTVQSEHTDEFVLSRVGDVGDAAELFTKRSKERMYALRLSGKGRKTVTVIAPKEILKYLQQVLAGWKGKSWDEVKELPIAKDLATYRTQEKHVVTEARKLLRKVVSIQARIDALVYELYGLTDKEIRIVEEKLTADS